MFSLHANISFGFLKGFLTGSWNVMPMDAGAPAAFISVDRAIRIFSSRCAQCASAKHPRGSQTPECFVYGYMSGFVEHLERSAMATLASNCDWSGLPSPKYIWNYHFSDLLSCWAQLVC